MGTKAKFDGKEVTMPPQFEEKLRYLQVGDSVNYEDQGYVLGKKLLHMPASGEAYFLYSFGSDHK